MITPDMGPAHLRLRRPGRGEVATVAGLASQQSLDRLLREGRAEFLERPGRRTGRRGRTRPRAAAASSRPISSRRATSRRRSTSWSRACRRRARPGAARRHRLGQDLHHGAGHRGDAAPGDSSSRPTRRWPRSSTASSRASSPTTRSSISSPTTTTTSPRPTSRAPTPISRRNRSINEQIDRMRHSATRALLERDDVIVVASVSCIYGIGSVETYSAMTFSLKRGERIDQRAADRRPRRAAVPAQRPATSSAARSGCAATRSRFFPAHYEDRAWRISLFGDEIEAIHEFDPLTGEKTGDLAIRQGLRQLPLRDAAADAAAGDRADQARAEAPPRRAQRRRPAARGAAARAAHDLRPRDDRGDRLLRRHRELFALSHRPQARRAAADPVRIPSRQRARLRRREPRHGAAARRHVPRRLPPQDDARRIRLPAALLHRQPAAQIRGMGRDAAADACCLGHARAVGDGANRRRLRRAGDPPDRPHRPAGRHPPGAHAGRRPHRRGAAGGAAGLPRARHHARPSAWPRT